MAEPDDAAISTGSTELDRLWAEITSHCYPTAERPDLATPRPHHLLRHTLPRTQLAKTLTHDGDLMPDGRPKVIHAHGAVACIEYEPSVGNGCTGVFATGAVGLLRMSLAIRPGRSAITPGFGLKFMLDGGDSLDVLAMNHTCGQGRDFNLFSNSFTNDLRAGHDHLRFEQKLMRRLFTRVAPEPRYLRIDHLATRTRSGDRVAEPVAPSRLVFEPTDDARAIYDGAHAEDFRDPLLRAERGTALYDVFREDDRDGPLGVIRLISKFVCSAIGDRLFFQHHVDETHPSLR